MRQSLTARAELASPHERPAPGDPHPGAPEFGHGDLPVALSGAHHRVRDRQPEPGSRLRSRRAVEAIEHRVALVLGDPGAGVIDAEFTRPPALRTLTSTRPPSPANLHALSMRTPARRSIRSARAWTVKGPPPTRWAVSATRRVVAGAPNRWTHAAATSAMSTTSASSSGVTWLSARASHSRSSTMPGAVRSRGSPVRARPGRRRDHEVDRAPTPPRPQ